MTLGGAWLFSEKPSDLLGESRGLDLGQFLRTTQKLAQEAGRHLAGPGAHLLSAVSPGGAGLVGVAWALCKPSRPSFTLEKAQPGPNRLGEGVKMRHQRNSALLVLEGGSPWPFLTVSVNGFQEHARCEPGFSLSFCG